MGQAAYPAFPALYRLADAPVGSPSLMDGASVGSMVGLMAGASVGSIVAASVCSIVAVAVGDSVSVAVGASVGVAVGSMVGASMGVADGASVGSMAGGSVGVSVGVAVGPLVGTSVAGTSAQLALVGIHVDVRTWASYMDLTGHEWKTVFLEHFFGFDGCDTAGFAGCTCWCIWFGVLDSNCMAVRVIEVINATFQHSCDVTQVTTLLAVRIELVDGKTVDKVARAYKVADKVADTG